jgi:hypothetical protein
MTSRILFPLILLTACQLDLKNIGDPTGDTSGGTDEGGGTDSASSEPINGSQGSATEPATTSQGSTYDPSETDGGTSNSSSTMGPETTGSEPSTTTSSEPSTTTGPEPGTSTSTTTGPEPGTTSMGTVGTDTGEQEVMCQNGPEGFPVFDKVCETDNDCSIGYHGIDCCTSLAAIGIQADDQRAFNEAETLCQSQYILCDCIPDDTLAEDGFKQKQGDSIGVACLDGLCRTFIEN